MLMIMTNEDDENESDDHKDNNNAQILITLISKILRGLKYKTSLGVGLLWVSVAFNKQSNKALL